MDLGSVRWFRMVVACCLVTEVGLLLVPSMEEVLLSGAARESYENNGLGAIFLAPPIIWYMVKGSVLLGLVGLFFMRKVARSVYLAAIAVSIALAVIGGLGVGSSLAVSLGYLSAMLQGGVLVLSYSSVIASRMR
jgi:hypothetical protein